MSRGLEIERKFLVEHLPDDLEKGEAIEQGYLAISDDGVEVRIRRRAGQATLTVKSGPGVVRTEEEMAIDARRFEALWPLTAPRRLVKTRHLISAERGVTIELDVYGGRHRGLVTAEIEFASMEASERYEPPPWLGREVTGDRRFANQALAVNGLPAA